jgi:hypothetical protein
MTKTNSQRLIAMLSMAILLIALTPSRAFALATATATAAQGNNCGNISIPRNQDPGIMTVKKVLINGVETTNYSVVDGTNNSSRPKIKFDPALDANDVVTVELTTKNSGTYTVNLKLETKERGC